MIGWMPLKRLVAVTLFVALAGCAADYSQLAVRDGTVVESFHSMRAVFRPSAGGAAAGAAAGGKTEMVPYSEVAFRDNTSGETFRANLDGHWVDGTRVQFSVTPENKLVLR